MADLDERFGENPAVGSPNGALQRKGLRNLEWLVARHDVQVWSGALKQREAIAHADVIIILDTNALDRLGIVGPTLHSSRATKLLLDHHLKPESWFDAAYARRPG